MTTLLTPLGVEPFRYKAIRAIVLQTKTQHIIVQDCFAQEQIARTSANL